MDKEISREPADPDPPEARQRPAKALRHARAVEERARRLQAEAVEPADGASPSRQPKRFRRYRFLLWGIQIVVALTLLEHFVLRPQVEARRRQAAARHAKAVVAGSDPVTPLGDEAVELQGLTETVPAHFAPTQALATGSLSMRYAQEETSREYRIPVSVTNSIGMRFRLVPAGTAVMGSPEDEPGRGACEVLHVTAIPMPFYLGEMEVTQAQWRRVMPSNPSHFTGENRPVEEVTWYDCQRYLLKLAELEGLPKGAYRLPTEAEWEYACRGGAQTAFCFGNNASLLEKYADYADNNYHGTNEVGQRLPNSLGLYDMHGNVWEWCLDRYSNYPGDETPIGDKEGWRCLRGGNWYVAAAECRSANRCRLPPASNGNMLGFRVVRTLPEIFGELEIPVREDSPSPPPSPSEDLRSPE